MRLVSIEDLERAQDMTKNVLALVSDDQLDMPTPCKSWCVRDVIDHLIAENHLFAEKLTLASPDAGASASDGIDQLILEFDVACARAIEAFSGPGALERMVTMPAGEFPATIFLALATCENFIHGWDLADAIDMRSLIDNDLAESLFSGPVVRGLKDEMRGPDREASFGPRQSVSGDAPMADQLAAFFGRTA
jgi:uncharacterized protein (TIGR03086 family)